MSDIAEKVLSAMEDAWDTKFGQRDAKFAWEIIGTGCLLDGLFRDDQVVRDWLREPNKLLSDEAPLDHIQTNGLNGARRVRDVVELICNLK